MTDIILWKKQKKKDSIRDLFPFFAKKVLFAV